MSDQPMTEEEFWAILQAPIETKPIFYRLYYNDDGTPICYSMEQLPHNYIELTLEQYHLRSDHVRVINGQLVYVNPASYTKKLRPDTEGTACDPRDICVVVEQYKPNIKWRLKTNEAS